MLVCVCVCVFSSTSILVTDGLTLRSGDNFQGEVILAISYFIKEPVYVQGLN